MCRESNPSRHIGKNFKKFFWGGKSAVAELKRPELEHMNLMLPLTIESFSGSLFGQEILHRRSARSSK